MFKNLWFEYCKVILLVFLAFNNAESNICKDNKLCQGRGGCFIMEETSHPSFLSTKCVCVRGYSGRWCQFQEDGIKLDSKERKQLNDRPVSPKIISKLSTSINEHSYNLIWEKPRETIPILYYALRYRMVGETQWKNVNEIPANKTQTRYSYVFKYLQWNMNYEVKIYAGSSHGVGRPATTAIRAAKIDYPAIDDVSEDKTGVNAILVNTRFTLRCNVRGKPSPTISWTLNGKTLSKGRKIVLSGGILTISKASIKQHQGVYRCVANNSWGTIMSRRIQVHVTAPVKFVSSIHRHTLKEKTQEIAIGVTTAFFCPLHRPLNSGLSYKWGNRFTNSSNDFDIETNKRVWITPSGHLLFSNIKPSDIALINRTGIRCIIEQQTSTGVITVMSNILKVSVGPVPKGPGWFGFLYKPPKAVTLLRGDSLELYCSAFTTLRGEIRINWLIDSKASNTTVLTDGRFLKITNTQKSDSGKITCKAFKLHNGGISGDFIATDTLLTVLDRPEDVIGNLPGKVSVYSLSTLRLGPSRSDFSTSWYFNGKRLTKKTYLELGKKHLSNSGIYQVDLIYKKISYTASVYIYFIDEESKEETISGRSGIQLYCVPPMTYLLPDINVKFASSCGSKVVNNTIMITQETAWKHDICSCKAEGNLFSVQRQFKWDFNGAMFSSNNRWVWSQWSPWSSCPNAQELCGQDFISSRHRSCYNPSPTVDGEYCSGNRTQKQPCPFIVCRKKVPSFWAPWSIWSDCSNPCGSGTQSRRRMCITPSNNPCPEGKWHETKKCRGSVCYHVVENWGKWTQWSECSKSCGIGTRMRRRQCSRQRCLGRSKEHLRCHTRCKTSEEDESIAKEIYSKGLFYLPNTVALGTAIFLIGLAISMAIHNCRKKSLKKSKHKRLLQDLFSKPDLDVEREPLLETETRPPPQANKRPPSRGHRQGNMATQDPTEPKNIARFKHRTDSKSNARPGKESSASLAPATHPGNLPPPSPSLLAPTGGIASTSSAGGMVPPPAKGVGPSASPPPPPPPPPPKR